MDFNDTLYVAGVHQRKRLRERTNEKNLYNMVRNGNLVLMDRKQRYFKYSDYLIPTIKGDGGLNVIKTVLDKNMYVYES